MWMLSRHHGSLNSSLGKLKPRKVRSLSRGHSTRANSDLPHNPATEGMCLCVLIHEPEEAMLT